MSGFLQRIAAAAAGPKVSAHPFVESIYPASRREEPRESLLQSEVATVSREDMSDRGLNSDVSDEVVYRGGKLWSQADGVPAPKSSVSVEREHFQPLLPQPGIEIHSLSHTSRSAEHLEDGSGPGSSASQHDIATLETLAYQPLVGQLSVQESVINADRPSGVYPLDENKFAAGSNPGRWPAQAQPAAHSAASQGEDIQIHIGRIEVVAVPQPQPRPATAPVRRGLSLDEYLGLANGRGR